MKFKQLFEPDSLTNCYVCVLPLIIALSYRSLRENQLVK